MQSSEPLVKPAWRRAIIAALTLAFLILLANIYPLISDLVVVLIISLVLAYVIRPFMTSMEGRGISRIYTILGSFIVLGGLIVLLLRYFIPVLIEEVGSLRSNLGVLDVETVADKLSYWAESKMPGASTMLGLDVESLNSVVANFQSKATGFLSTLGGLLAGAANAIALSIVIPFITFFILRDGDEWNKRWIESVPNRYFEMTMSLSYKVDQKLGNYIRSILLESLIIGIISWIAFEVMGLKFALVLGIVCGLLNMIPFFGPLLAWFPVLLVVLLTYSPIPAGLLYAAIILVGVQMVDNILLKPILISRSVNVHPAAVLMAVLIGGRLAGALGMFVAVPVYAVIQILVVDLYTHLRDYKII
ncbi:MAG: AI-2E family transporter [Candidatus Electryonea clarkiae]|nr:AI-2E family transporter [Candidatus Electryonea clarkiae]MDP8287223.1 AI-2E family transporter [Candidatus Electryonea clarkiae]